MPKQTAALVRIGSITKQSSNARITFPITVELNEKSLAVLPDWVAEAFHAVQGRFTKVTPEIKSLPGVLIGFTSEKPPSSGLFVAPKAKTKDAELKGFTVLRTGDPDDPDFELHFAVFCPFSREFWAWLGEMAGEQVYMGFPAALTGAAEPEAKSGTLPGLDVPASVAGTQDAGKPAKIGPKDLTKLHETQKPN